MENTENKEQSGKKKGNKVLYWVLIGVFAAIFLVSGTIVAKYLVDSHQRGQKIDSLQSMHDLHTRPSRPVRPSTSSEPSGTESTGTQPSVTQPSGTDPIAPPTTNNGETTPTDPTVPQPTEPRPTDPQPTEPRPTEPKPTQPQPTEPQPTTPEPTVPIQPPHVDKEIMESMRDLYELNNDLVGWVQIPDTPNNVSYPVLQRPDDPDYYLYRDFYGEDDNAGSIYAEEHADVFGPSDVVTLHGHHMGDGTMFHDLKNFKSKSYFDSHKTVYFDTLYDYREYEVVMVLQCNGSPSNYYPYFAYHAYKNFKTEAGFNNYVNSLREIAIQGEDAELTYGDKLLLLSTCDYGTYPDGRMVVVCKLIAEY